FRAFTSIGGPGILGLIHLLKDPEIPVGLHVRILFALNTIPTLEYMTLDEKQTKNAIDGLADMLNDKEVQNRLMAIDAIGWFGDRGKMGFDHLKKFIQNASDVEQVRAGKALARISQGDEFTVALLLKLLGHDKQTVRQQAAEGLGLC